MLTSVWTIFRYLFTVQNTDPVHTYIDYCSSFWIQKPSEGSNHNIEVLHHNSKEAVGFIIVTHKRTILLY